MTLFARIAHAVVVLPAADRASVPAAPWLAKARWQPAGAPEEPLRRVLARLGASPPADGLALLRYQGQTGQIPARWLCGADPVHFEARLDHLRLFRLADVSDDELVRLFADVEARLADDGGDTFSVIGGCGYLERDAALATAPVSAATVHGLPPDPFLPVGPGAAAHDRLQGELQLCLHETPVNREREAEGRAAVNGLWLWGGGDPAPRPREALPRLFADDPLFTGCWSAAGAEVSRWPGGLRACASGGRPFVAVVPPGQDPAALAGELKSLRRRCRRLTLMSGDGRTAELTRAVRPWRRPRGAGER